jgi:hypothetical protein
MDAGSIEEISLLGAVLHLDGAPPTFHEVAKRALAFLVMNECMNVEWWPGSEPLSIQVALQRSR